MIAFLKKPYPYTERKRIFVIDVFIALFVFIFLYFFQPFGLNNLPSSEIFKNTLIYGLITFLICCFFRLVIPFLFPNYFDEDKWNVGRQILHITTVIVFIVISNYTYSLTQGFTNLSFSGFIWMLGPTISIGGIIVVALVLFEANRSLKKNLLAAQNMSAKIDLSKTKVNVEPILKKEVIHLPSEVESQNLDIEIKKLIYLTSVANYIECFYLNESGKIVSSKIRNRMKIVESIFDQESDFFRCHRAFIVNMNYVQSIDGNAKGYTLVLKNTDVLIPVARSKSSELRERFN